MNLIRRVVIKSKSAYNFLVFQKQGFPVKKEEKISKSVLRKYVPAKPVIIDCGAHDGADSVELARILGGTVHAFEPVKEIFERLKKNAAPYANIKCYSLALGNVNGIQSFYVSEGGSDASSSLLKPQEHLIDHPDVSFDRQIQVATKKLDQWAKDENIGAVDLLWLDMQGFELEMLKASPQILSTVKAIHTEVSVKKTYDGVPLYSEFKEWLEAQGFKMVIEAIPPGWDMGNALFVR